MPGPLVYPHTKGGTMAAVPTSIARRSLVAGLTLIAASVAALAGTDNAYAQATQSMPRRACTRGWAVSSPSRRWWITSAKRPRENPIVGQKSKNAQLREWHTKNLGRLPGLKFMRTLWVCDVSGGPF